MKIVDATEPGAITEFPEYERMSDYQREVFRQLEPMLIQAGKEERFDKCVQFMFVFAIGALLGSGWTPDQIRAELERRIADTNERRERKPE